MSSIPLSLTLHSLQPVMVEAGSVSGHQVWKEHSRRRRGRRRHGSRTQGGGKSGQIQRGSTAIKSNDFEARLSPISCVVQAIREEKKGLYLRLELGANEAKRLEAVAGGNPGLVEAKREDEEEQVEDEMALELVGADGLIKAAMENKLELRLLVDVLLTLVLSPALAISVTFSGAKISMGDWGCLFRSCSYIK